MGSLLYAENKRVLKQRGVILILFLLYTFIFIRCKDSTRQYDTREMSFSNLMDRYASDSIRYPIETVIKDGSKKLTSEEYKREILHIINRISYQGEGDIHKKRVEKLKEALSDYYISYRPEVIEEVVKELGETKIDLSYAEGYKAMLAQFPLFVKVMFLFLSIYAANLFSISGEGELSLYRSTFHGTKNLFRIKAILSLIHGFTAYVLGVGIFIIVYFIKYGSDGGDIFVGSSGENLLTMYDYTYREAFFRFVLIGLLGVFTILFSIAVISKMTRDFSKIVTIIVAYFSFLILMDQMGNFFVKYSFFNFLIFKLTDFNYHLRHYHIYELFGRVIKGLDFILIICGIKIFVLLGILLYRNLKEDRYSRPKIYKI